MTNAFRPATPTEQRAADTPPAGKRRGRPPGSTNRSRKSLKAPIERLLVTVNIVVQAVAPRDALDGIEIAALATALDEQAKVSPRFRKGIEAIVGVAGGGSLIPVLAIIGGRRLSRHGILPGGDMVDQMGGIFLQMGTASPSEAAEAMDAVMVGLFGRNTNGTGNPEQPSAD